MTQELQDLLQRLSNLIRVGKVVAIQLDPPRAKVRFGDNTTALIPWKTARSGDVKEWDPPSIGEQVSIMSPSGELGAAYIEYGSIPTTGAAAGNTAKSRLVILPADGNWKILCGSGSIELTESSAKMTIGGAVFEIAGGKLTFDGDIEATGDVKAGSVSLTNHTHGGVEAGGSNTAPPN